MPTNAKLYINSTIVLGVSVLAGCLLYEREFTDPLRYYYSRTITV